MNWPTSLDQVMDGRLRIEQPVSGHRFGMDTLMLASFAHDLDDKEVLELGTGVGVVALILGQRYPNARITAVELLPELVALANQNLVHNQLIGRIRFIAGDVADYVPEAGQTFDLVLYNPPFYGGRGQQKSPNPLREAARFDSENIAHTWLALAARWLKHRGLVKLIYPAERLNDLLANVPKSLGSPLIYPLWPKPGRPAKRVLIQLQKGGKAGLKLLPGLLLHESSGKATSEAEAILRHGATMNWD